LLVVVAEDEGETKHLQALDGAGARLRLFHMDLLDPASSMRSAIEGARGVFHLASPVILHPTQDPEAIPSSPYARSNPDQKNSTSRHVLIRVTRSVASISCFQKELVEPAVKGTLGVLRAARDCGVGRVVMVSSQTAMVPNPRWPADKVIDEDSWADIDLLKELQVHI
jgi:nucleoside-diphosphate-sugar epimerase